MIIGWLVSGDPWIGVSIGSIEVVTKIFLYYAHERAWYRFSRFGLNLKKGDKNVD